MMPIYRNKAQSILEYAVLTIAVIAAFAVMYYIFKGHLSGSMRSSADTIGAGEQYEPK